MDLEDTQRVNVLAKELKEHGIACSLDEAEQKAKNMILKAEKNKPESDELNLLDQRYKFLLNSQSQRFTEEINGLKECLSSMSSELAALKRKLNEQKQEIKETTEKQNVSDKPKAEVQQKITENKEEKTEELKPEDITIEKFFYCGQK